MKIFTRIIAILLAITATAFCVFWGLTYFIFNDPIKNFERTNDIKPLMANIKTLEQDTQKNPQGFSDIAQLARLYNYIGKDELAVNHYGKIWNYIQDKPEHLTNFADSLLKFRGKFNSKILQILDQALTLDPNFIDALLLKSNYYILQKDQDNALKYLYKAQQEISDDQQLEQVNELIKSVKKLK